MYIYINKCIYIGLYKMCLYIYIYIYIYICKVLISIHSSGSMTEIHGLGVFRICFNFLS